MQRFGRIGVRCLLFALALTAVSPVPANAQADVETEATQRSALDRERQRNPVDPSQLAQRLYELADTLRVTDKPAEAEPLAREALAQRVVRDARRGDALVLLASVLNDLARHAEAEPLARESVALRARLLGADHARTANARRVLAQALAGQEKLVDAEAAYRAVYETRKLAGGTDSLGDAANDLADILVRLRRAGDAEPLLREALRIGEADDPGANYVQYRRLALGESLVALQSYAEAEALLGTGLKALDDGSDARTEELRGYLYQHAFALDLLGREAEAEPLYRRVLKSEEAALGAQHRDVAVTLSNLGSTLADLGRLRESEAALRRAISIFDAAGEKGDSLAQALEGLSVTLSRSGATANFPEMRSLLERALALRGGDEQPSLGASGTLKMMASAYSSVGRNDEAEGMLLRGIDMLRTLQGEQGERFLQTKRDYVYMLLDLGRYTDAERNARELLSIRQQLGEPQETARAAVALSSALVEQANFEGSGTIGRYALALLQGAGKGEGIDAANAINSIARSEQERGRLREAETLYRAALNIWERSVAPINRNIGAALRHLSANLILQQRYAEAEPLLRRAREVFIAAEGEDGNSAWTAVALAEVLGKLGRDAEAVGLYHLALDLYVRVRGIEHPSRLDPLVSYGQYALDGGDARLALTQFRTAVPIVLKRAAQAGLDINARREFEQNRGVFILQVRAAWQVAAEVTRDMSLVK